MVTDKTQYYLGEGIKVFLELSPLEEHPEIDIEKAELTVDLWCKPNKVVTIQNEKIKLKKKETAYIITLNSEAVGVGSLNLKVTAKIEDTDFDEGYNYVICLDNDIAEILKPQ